MISDIHTFVILDLFPPCFYHCTENAFVVASSRNCGNIFIYIKNNNYKLYTSGSDHTVPDQIGFVCHKDAGLSFYLRPDVMKNPINGCSSCHFSDLWLANTFTVLDRKCQNKTDREKINSLIRQFPLNILFIQKFRCQFKFYCIGKVDFDVVSLSILNGWKYGKTRAFQPVGLTQRALVIDSKNDKESIRRISPKLVLNLIINNYSLNANQTNTLILLTDISPCWWSTNIIRVSSPSTLTLTSLHTSSSAENTQIIKNLNFLVLSTPSKPPYLILCNECKIDQFRILSIIKITVTNKSHSEESEY